MTREYSHERFHYHKESGTFTAEVSELREWIVRDPIRVIGKKETVTYGFWKTIQNDEGEIQGWELVPSTREQERVPGCKGTKVVIFND